MAGSNQMNMDAFLASFIITILIIVFLSKYLENILENAMKFWPGAPRESYGLKAMSFICFVCDLGSMYFA